MTPRASRRLFLLLLLVASASNASGQLDDCRSLRHAEPARALPACEKAAVALTETGEADDAFEALMHAAQVASQLGETARADAALDRATLLLADVADPLAAHRLARRRALNAYRDRRPVEALGRFLEALAAARAAGDTIAIAVSDNDLGVAYRHLGDYPASLEHFQASLRAKQAVGDTDLGTSLSNVGSLLLELGDLERAQEYLERALAQHRESDRPLLAAQTQEELARLADAGNRIAAAREALDQAWASYVTADSPRDRLRVALQRADLEARRGDRDLALQWLAKARTLTPSPNRTESIRLALTAARLAQQEDERNAAYDALARSLEGDGGDDVPAIATEAQSTLSELAESLGRYPQALRHARAFQQAAAAQALTRHGERLDALRVRFEVAQLEAERDRLVSEAARHDAELGRRRLQTLLVACIALMALALLMLFSQRRLYRQRLRAQQAQRVLEERVEQARSAAALLRSDLRSMAWLLDRENHAALVFDAAGHVRAVTAAAAQSLGRTSESLHGELLTDVVGHEVSDWAQSVVESSSLTPDPSAPDETRTLPATGVSVRCQRLALEEELGVLLFEPATPGASSARRFDANDLPALDEVRAGSDVARQEMREQIVALMQASLEAWERCTRKSRIDLAEASGIWRITIDDGRLRVRAMDRYLSLDALPERPRWREVLRTAYFVLAELQLEPGQRQRLEGLVDTVLAATRRSP